MPVFPPNGGPQFSGYETLFVDPSGSNNGLGTQNSPLKTKAKAYSLLSPDGGEIWFSPHSKWSDGTEGLGLTDNQGIWLNDGTAVPGFLGVKNITFQGYGTATFGPFGTQASFMQVGKADGSTTRDNPGIWLSQVGVPVTFKNCAIIADQPARIGWDYRRKSDFTVKNLAITNASRAAGLTTLTCTLTTSPITSMSRSGGVVTVKYTLDELYQAVQINSCVRVNAGDKSADFPNGDYQVTEVAVLGGGVYSFGYIQGVTDKAEEFPVGATLATTGVAHSDFTLYGVVEITSNSNEFPATMYVTAAYSSDASKIIVRDPYGGNHGRSATVSVNNIGNMRVQFRYLSATFETFDDCVMYAGTVGGEKFGLGPTIDKADINGGAQWSWYRRCYLQGSVTGDPIAQQEIARCSNIFNTGVNAVGGGFYQLNMTEGGIYHPIVTSFCPVTYDTILQDTAIGTPIFKTLVMESGSGSVNIKNVSMADVAAPFTAVDIGAVGGAITMENSGATGDLTTLFRTPPVNFGGNDTSTVYWQAQTKSLEAMLHNGFWAIDGRIAGKRDDIQSSFGVIQHPGYSNLANTDLTAWTTVGSVTVTANQSTAGLDKADKAFKLHCSSGSGSIYLDITTPSATAGDRIIMGFWLRAGTDFIPSGFITDGVYDPASTKIPVFSQESPFGNDGAWDWLENIAPVLSSHAGLTTIRWQIFVAAGHDIIVYMPKMNYLSATAYSHNEAARQMRASRTVPPSLGNGMAGTMPGIKLIGTGGLGTATADVTVTSPGTADRLLTIYDEAGNALIKLHGQAP